MSKIYRGISRERGTIRRKRERERGGRGIQRGNILGMRICK